jgi:hypothetical protein
MGGALSSFLVERYRCSEAFLNFQPSGNVSADAGFFRFGRDAICYARSSAGFRSHQVESDLYDLSGDISIRSSEVRLPFNPTEVISNFCLERYPGTQPSRAHSLAKAGYYSLRPFLPRATRRQIQRFRLRRWREVSFPGWPIDRTVENICERLLLLALEVAGVDRIPFIWFWPHGSSGCAIMTHDVETEAGRDFCAELMDIDDLFGIKASFQIVPERRYSLPPNFLANMRDRGFEPGVQDLNHDGMLFSDRSEFLKRAKIINQYGRAYGAKGFRAAVLYRNPAWFDALDFSFDMSIPNTARLDPQPGGCCTVMPYFISEILEMPVTAIQDYSLFHLLRERSIDLWKQQIDLILEKNGLMSFIVHPDYVMEDGLISIYKDLLRHLSQLKSDEGIWVALPSEVDRWWRERSKMRLVPGDHWQIEGEGAERAVVAYARNANGKLVYEIEAKRVLAVN